MTREKRTLLSASGSILFGVSMNLIAHGYLWAIPMVIAGFAIYLTNPMFERPRNWIAMKYKVRRLIAKSRSDLYGHGGSARKTSPGPQAGDDPKG